MRVMAQRAVFCYRRMLPEKRSALFGVALVTELIDAIGAQQRIRRRAVWRVTIAADQARFVRAEERLIEEAGVDLRQPGVARPAEFDLICLRRRDMRVVACPAVFLGNRVGILRFQSILHPVVAGKAEVGLGLSQRFATFSEMWHMAG